MSNNAIIFCKGLYSLVVMNFMCKRQQSSTVILTNRLSASLTKNNNQDGSVANGESPELIVQNVQLHHRASSELKGKTFIFCFDLLSLIYHKHCALYD